jgi:hypothetical protein
MIEYILVITVSVVIILGLMEKMYTPLGAFVESIMGTYVECLLETGELPKMGDTSGDDSGECQYSLPWVDADGGSSTTDRRTAQGKSGSGDDEGGGDDESSASEGGSTGPGRAMSRRSSRGPRRTVVGGASNLRGGSMGSEGASAGEASRTTVAAVESEGRGRGFFSAAGGNRIVRQRSRYIAVSGEVAQELAKKKKKEDKQTQSVQRLEGGGGVRAKKLTLKPPEKRRIAESEIKSQGIDIALIVKYLLIGGIIILLIVLIGGQVLQMSKNWEKSE